VGPKGSVVGVEINAEAVALARQHVAEQNSETSRFIRQMRKPRACLVNPSISPRPGWCW
jgi:hypothetical protein